ncbi:MAG: metalloregulator ArsR/SmtB family transcription factor [Rhodospirillales bacterium]|nr:metalloregulator ArsR/SmtB family transcription factor [Rhodospirillales bacterium]
MMEFDPHQFLVALAEPTRLRSLMLLTSNDPLCVCELTWALDVSQPKMSRHLAFLRDCGIVEDRKVANRVFYRLSPSLPEWAKSVLNSVSEGTQSRGRFEEDRERLAAMPDRPDRTLVMVSA